MTTHDFTPITSPERLEAALEYVVQQSRELARVVLGRELHVDTIGLFTHSSQEYDFLLKAVRARGPESALMHEPTIYVDCDFEIAGNRIRLLGVRKPDETRPEIGYGDYPVDGFAALIAACEGNPYAQSIISGRGQPLLQLKHPDFDVRGYAFAPGDQA